MSLAVPPPRNPWGLLAIAAWLLLCVVLGAVDVVQPPVLS